MAPSKSCTAFTCAGPDSAAGATGAAGAANAGAAAASDRPSTAWTKNVMGSLSTAIDDSCSARHPVLDLETELHLDQRVFCDASGMRIARQRAVGDAAQRGDEAV